MCRTIIWRQLDGRPKLRYGAVEISRLKQPLAGIRIERRSLQTVRLLHQFLCAMAFRICSSSIALLPKNCGQVRMRADQIRIDLNRFAQRGSRIIELPVLL